MWSWSWPRLCVWGGVYVFVYGWVGVFVCVCPEDEGYRERGREGRRMKISLTGDVCVHGREMCRCAWDNMMDM